MPGQTGQLSVLPTEGQAESKGHRQECGQLAQENELFCANHGCLEDGKERGLTFTPVWAVCSKVAFGPRSPQSMPWRLLDSLINTDHRDHRLPEISSDSSLQEWLSLSIVATEELAPSTVILAISAVCRSMRRKTEVHRCMCTYTHACTF